MKKTKQLIILMMSIMLLTISCGKEESPAESENNGGFTTNPSAPYYFQINLDNEEILLQQGGNFASGAGAHGIGTTESGNVKKEQSSGIFNLVEGGTIGGYSIIKAYEIYPSVCADLEPMFYLGTYTYGNINTDVDGVIVWHLDDNGVYWTTDQGAATQTGSNFEITELIDNDGIESEKITTAVFNCTLYDTNGNSKIVSNGKIRSFSLQCGHL